MKTTLGCVRRADDDFGLLQDGDAVAVGVSGGKDSMLLLYALSLYRRFSKKAYTVTAIHINPGMGFDDRPIADFCAQQALPYVRVETQLLAAAMAGMNARGDATPCSLCAKMRRGALNEAAVQAGCNKVALGHHRDDALETFLMSMFFEGRLNTLQPISYLSRTKITVIRPFLYHREKDIIAAGHRVQLPVMASPCPFDGFTNRARMKTLIKDLHTSMPRADEMMFRALKNVTGYNLWDKYRLPTEDAAPTKNRP